MQKLFQQTADNDASPLKENLPPSNNPTTISLELWELDNALGRELKIKQRDLKAMQKLQEKMAFHAKFLEEISVKFEKLQGAFSNKSVLPRKNELLVQAETAPKPISLDKTSQE